MTTEKSITKSITANLDRHGIFWLKIHGSPMQRRGMPDLLVIKEGRAYFFEIKVPGNKPTMLQHHRLEQIQHAGAVALAVHDWDEVKTTLGI